VSSQTCVSCPPAVAGTPVPSVLTNSFPGASKCACPAGYTGPSLGPCSPCAPTQYKSILGSHACEPCNAGSYQASDAATACTLCPPYSTSAPGSAAAANCTCAPAYTGTPWTMIDDTKESDSTSNASNASSLRGCFPCAAGKFKEEAGSAECTSCPPGSYSTAAALACTTCPPQTYNQFVGAPGRESCIACPKLSKAKAGSSSAANCTCLPGHWVRDNTCVSCADCDLRQSTLEYASRGTCLPCPTGNQDKYAGQGPVLKVACEGSDAYYSFKYSWTKNHLRLSWTSATDWRAMFPSVEQPALTYDALLNASSLGVLFETQDLVLYTHTRTHTKHTHTHTHTHMYTHSHTQVCKTNCSAGWRWLNAADWFQKCLATPVGRERCEASVYPEVRVLMYAAADFVHRGRRMSNGAELGQRYNRYAFGGCWPCSVLLCPRGFEGNTTSEDLKDTCPSARTGNAESNPDMSLCAPRPLQTSPPPGRGELPEGL
jgi:hypothetical protein